MAIDVCVRTPRVCVFAPITMNVCESVWYRYVGFPNCMQLLVRNVHEVRKRKQNEMAKCGPGNKLLLAEMAIMRCEERCVRSACVFHISVENKNENENGKNRSMRSLSIQ